VANNVVLLLCRLTGSGTPGGTAGVTVSGIIHGSLNPDWLGKRPDEDEHSYHSYHTAILAEDENNDDENSNGTKDSSAPRR